MTTRTISFLFNNFFAFCNTDNTDNNDRRLSGILCYTLPNRLPKVVSFETRTIFLLTKKWIACNSSNISYFFFKLGKQLVSDKLKILT